MQVAAAVLVVAVAALHTYLLVLEMFLWQTPLGLRTFRMTKEAAAATAILAGNQGLYNGFLAAGLVWGLVAYGVVGGRGILTFFLLCIIVAGVYGGGPRRRRIIVVQSVSGPAGPGVTWLPPLIRRAPGKSPLMLFAGSRSPQSP